VLSRGL